MRNRVARMLMVSLPLLALSMGCERTPSQKAEDAADAALNRVEDAVDATQDSVEAAGDKIEDATDR